MAFDRKAYQREYMRQRRVNGKTNGKSKDNVVEMKPRRRPVLGVDDILALAKAVGRKPSPRPFELPKPPPGVVPDKNRTLAMDSDIGAQMAFMNSMLGGTFEGIASEGLVFLGYPFLSQLAQRAEYRIPTETIATEMTRRWIKFRAINTKEAKQAQREEEAEEAEAEGKSPGEPGSERPEDNVEPAALAKAMLSGDFAAPGEEEQGESEGEVEKAGDEKADKIQELEDEFARLEVRDVFKVIAMHDGFYGIGHLFLDFGVGLDDTRGELTTDIGDGLNEASQGKITKGSLKRLAAIEPVWTYPTVYNATNPLRSDWYSPTIWYAMGIEIHCSRLLTFVGRPVPDLLKPSYMFGGLSLSQLVQPYVTLWLNIRENIGRLIQAFSVMVLGTDLSTQMQPGTGESMWERAAMFNGLRDNAGLMVINKNTEEFQNVSAPLSGLHELQAQAQEHMAAVVRIPLVKFTGISPAGLNASSEGEIRVFYDTIHAYQESLFRPNLTRVMHFVMLSLWGKVDEDITFDFEPLWALSEKEEAEVRKMDAETDDILVNGAAALHPEEVRKRIAADPDSPYSDIDVEDVPEPPEDPQKINLRGTTPFGQGAAGGGGGGEGGGEGGGGGGQDAVIPFAGDEFKESEHPRDKGGQFTSGGGGGGGGGSSGGTPTFKSKKEHAGHLLSQGVTTEQMLKSLGWPSISMPAMAKALNMKLEKIKEGGVTKYKGTPMTKEEIEAAKAEAKAKKEAAPAPPLPPEPPKPPELPKTPEPPKTPATPAELQKAKKPNPLQAGYLPVSGPHAPKTLWMIEEFNKFYEGKQLTTTEQLQKKVDDFKALVEAAKTFNAGYAAEATKAQAEQQAKAAAAAKAAKEAAAAKNKEYMQELGITEVEAAGFDALVNMLDKSSGDVVAQFKGYEEAAKKLNYPISGFQYALIRNYIDGGYHQINEHLRSGTLSTGMHVYARMVNSALDKLPKYSGTVTRGASLTLQQIANYKVGHVVEERAFTSTGIDYKFSGNVSYRIKAIGRRGGDFSKGANQHEKEVLFKAHTFFLVHKVEQKGGVTHIEMEEVEGHG